MRKWFKVAENETSQMVSTLPPRDERTYRLLLNGQTTDYGTDRKAANAAYVEASKTVENFATLQEVQYGIPCMIRACMPGGSSLGAMAAAGLPINPALVIEEERERST
jgi:hypothetical protein